MTTPEERAKAYADGYVEKLGDSYDKKTIDAYLAGFAECERLMLSGDLARVRFVGELPPLPYDAEDNT